MNMKDSKDNYQGISDSLKVGVDPSAKVIAINDNVLTIELVKNEGDEYGKLVKNEVVYVLPDRKNSKDIDEKLMAEVLRIDGNTAEIQVYEDTRGVGVGDCVIQTHNLLSVELGPGILGTIYDGLQAPLEAMASMHGTFLQRGVKLDSIDLSIIWPFTTSAKQGDKLRAGEVLGTTKESRFVHAIMVPFYIQGEVTIDWIQEGNFTADTVIARATDEKGNKHLFTMIQRWPIRRSIATCLSKSGGITTKRYPYEPLITQQRLIDTFFPIAKGGTACIPGPFGAGKTVLQHMISRYADIDIVIVIACGERAGEVVEMITEFPKLQDPSGTGSLMDRTAIICNTSSMPVAAREASLYTGLTLGEYYRQMGHHVLVLADSTSRWAQALRETSNRLEEIPGEEGFPAYIDSSIKNIYERAGLITNEESQTGSMTLIGTVSPAGGNFEEPVTQSTLATVKCFLGLSYDRAYKRFFPAVDPLISWSRYFDQLSNWYASNISPDWISNIQELRKLLVTADDVNQMMQVTGVEGVSMQDYLLSLKAHFFDAVYLQQDAFDAVDAFCPLERQIYSCKLILDIIKQEYNFDDKADARTFFTKLTGLYKNFNYSHAKSPEYNSYLKKITDLSMSNTKQTEVI